MKKIASDGAFFAECFVSNSHLISDSCWNRSSIVRLPPVFAVDGAPGCSASDSSDEAVAAAPPGSTGAVAAPVFAAVDERGPDEEVSGGGAGGGFEGVAMPESV